VEQLQKNHIPTANCSTPASRQQADASASRGGWNNSKNALKNVPRGTFYLLKKTYPQIINNYLTIFPLFIAFFSFFSILWTTDKVIALFRSIKLLEYVLLYFYLFSNVPRGTFQKFCKVFSSTQFKLFHVEQSQNIKDSQAPEINCSTWNISKKELLSSKPTIQQEELNVPRGTFFENLIILIISIGFIQAIIGIIQFIIQRSIGLFWLKESLISPQITGVAKVILHEETYVRAYGLFPHPNIFGGYLLFSIILTLLYTKLFHVEQFNSIQEGKKHGKIKCSTWNIFTVLSNIVPRGTILLQIIIIIQLLALLLTFSKSAIIGLFIGLFYIKTLLGGNNVPPASTRGNIRLLTRGGRGTFIGRLKTKMFHVEHFKRKAILLIGILILFFIVARPDIYSLFAKSLQERAFYLNISNKTLLTNPFLGLGAGQIVPNMAINYDLPFWQYQPVHNVYLIIANEYGIFMLLFFLVYIYLLFMDNKCSTRLDSRRRSLVDARRAWNIHTEAKTISAIYLRGALLGFLFIMLFDHYFWDIAQGQILLWILFGMIAGQQKFSDSKGKCV
jgi:hypothetical protein